MISIAAVAENDVIGISDGESSIPWSLPEDVKHYKETISGEVVLFGRKTFDAVGQKALTSNHNIMLTRDETLTEDEVPENILIARSKEEAIDILNDLDSDVVFNCGGGTIYDLFLDETDVLLLSEIPEEYEGDRYFPDFDRDQWTADFRKEYDNFTVVWYNRV